METEKINLKKVEECKKDSKVLDCKSILPKKARCPNGKIQTRMGKCRPLNSPCLDSKEYSDLI